MPTIKDKIEKLTKAGYVYAWASAYKKRSKKYPDEWIVVDLVKEVAYMEDKYGRRTSEEETIDWGKF